MHLREAVFDEFRGITNRNVWQQVEVDGHAGELVEVIDCLRTDDLLCGCYGAQRHEVGGSSSGGRDCSTACAARAEASSSVTMNVKVVKSGRLCPLVVFQLDIQLVSVLRLCVYIESC